MSDSGIKKAIVSILNMPPIDSQDEGYWVRYRIISDDRNRTSSWSPILLIKPEYTFVSGNIAFTKNNSIASTVWDSVTINKVTDDETYFIRKAVEYDIWVRWDRGDGSGDWIYKERIEGTSVSFPIPLTYTINGVVQPNSPNRLSIEVYLKGYPVSRDSTFLKVYELTNETV